MGDAVVDLIPEGEQHYLKCPGGAPANVAVGVARLGGESAFIGRVGADPFGRFMGETWPGRHLLKPFGVHPGNNDEATRRKLLPTDLALAFLCR
ncbi:PfkB family carbohydrate kinase, partial [Aeromonas caviae]